ncbi:hypothetical protein CHRY9390_02819 [Chryseobacterium aquaeductus]|uniref:ATPase AAA-type core domain-containing protein n=1 Tax=Chryseobacterium aquaeductus TaxID=2675056 RepID=A0A9N8QVQ6_9FLAO|nr:AAA family ATPase [Chryseobacterium aquaeductus]CAA7332098.1 hypothetical protein CHRY9390_02819 [Chryseobacterium potabilaquae]CAD7814523.1 hypothetical protein CHRY9390_02819 [Chryseobacterium aquaeductus]
MRLAAIYIKRHFLFSEPQTINLGGKYFYTITPREGKENKYDITRIENPQFIENFWGKKISLVSAIVGENGTGKTSFLKSICLSKTNINDIVLVFENKNNSYEIYDKGFLDNSIFSIDYFTQTLDSDLSHFSINSFLNFNTDFVGLSEFNLNNFKNLVLLIQKQNNEKLLKSYLRENFNLFDAVKIKLKNNLKTETYWGDKTKRQESTNDLIRLIIDKFGAKNDDVPTIFTSENFIKNLELKLLLAVININFDRYNNELEYNINEYNDKESFDNFLDKIKEDYIANKLIEDNNGDIDNQKINNIKEFYNFIKTSDYKEDKGNRILNLKEIKLFIDKYENIKPALDLFDFSPVKIDENNSNYSHISYSTGEKNILYFLSLINKNLKWFKKNIILLLDEADLGFHPQWKKKYIKILTDFLPKIFEEIPGFEGVQIIFTTHDPLTLSDIPNSNVVYLKKEGEKTKVLNQNEKPRKSFGANITDLLADSFFINDGLIGDFAKGKIEETIKWINLERHKKHSIYQQSYEIDEKEYIKHKKIIELIDENVVRMKLAEMLDELKPEKNFQKELAEKEIKYLRNKFNLK